MSSINSIAAEKLARLIGTPKCPVLVDVRVDEDFAAAPNLIPGSHRRRYEDVLEWRESLRGKSVVVICQKGGKLSHGVAALLRDSGIEAEVLDGGYLAWTAMNVPTVPAARIPLSAATGRSTWVTRERPKIDRIACPWLIRRFVDPVAVFMFVPTSEVISVAEHFEAAAFDIEGVYWSHRGERCTFDVMIEEFGLTSPPLLQLATIVRAADTARLDLAPEAAGLLAASLGLSRMFSDDLAQLEAGMTLYDAFYRWCRDATGETHNWPTNKVGV
jgi:rhodanese-related sulfurtransferase